MVSVYAAKKKNWQICVRFILMDFSENLPFVDVLQNLPWPSNWRRCYPKKPSKQERQFDISTL